MTAGPDVSDSNTLIPRPGVDCNIVLVYEPEDPSEIDLTTISERELAGIQSAVNERFAEPEEMGSLEATTRSELSVRPGFLIVSTTLSGVVPETWEEIGRIISNELRVSMELFKVSAEIKRKRAAPDFL